MIRSVEIQFKKWTKDQSLLECGVALKSIREMTPALYQDQAQGKRGTIATQVLLRDT